LRKCRKNFTASLSVKGQSVKLSWVVLLNRKNINEGVES
jgi:hypothetical protein